LFVLIAERLFGFRIVICFYKENIPDEKDEGKARFEVIFDKETKKLTFKEIRFETILGSNKLPTLQISKTLQS